MGDNLRNVSPVDGRYAKKIEEIRSIASEAGLIKYRVQVEVEWFIALSEDKQFSSLEEFPKEIKAKLRDLYLHFSQETASRIKEIESKTNHDVKAVEYFLREITREYLSPVSSGFIHFACTSEDINSASYALMIKDLLTITQKHLASLDKVFYDLISQWKNIPMLSRTHGQPASPTTVGKEFLVFRDRLERQINSLDKIPLMAKMSGAVGNFNAHAIAFSEVDWPAFSKRVIENSLYLKVNPVTTQIEPHDYMAEIFDCFSRICTILVDFCRDIWFYISMDYFTQIAISGEVGSSTMPHKINPIDFENAEGNFLLARNTLRFFSDKLPISRMQRDLTDSTTLRNIGVAFAHFHIGLSSLQKGLEKISVNESKMKFDLNNHWEILAEPVQTVMKRYGLTDPYEQLKEFTRGKIMEKDDIKMFIQQLDIPDLVKKELQKLTPANYIGNAIDIVEDRLRNYKEYISD